MIEFFDGLLKILKASLTLFLVIISVGGAFYLGYQVIIKYLTLS